MSLGVVCRGKRHEFERKVVEGEQHATLHALATTPSWATLSSWVMGTLNDLDPRPAHVTSLALEIIRVATSEREVVEAAPPPHPEAPPAPSPLRLKLLGTLIATDPAHSLASIQDCVTLETRTCGIGDVVHGAELLSIDRQRVIVKRDDRPEYLSASCDAR